MAPLPAEVEVLVVGSGPTGLACANLLGFYGIRTLLIERNNGVSTMPKAILIDDEFHRLLALIGAAPQLERHFVQGVGVTFYSPLGFPLVEVEGFVTANGFPNRSAIHQPTLEADLADHARRWPLVTLAYGYELRRLEQDENGVTAEIGTPNGSVETIRSSYVIGADGAHSAVRAAARIAFEGGSIDQPHLVIDVSDDPDQVRFSRFFCHPSRPRNSVPAPEGGRRYEFMLLDGEDPQQMAEESSIRQLVELVRPYEEVRIVRKAVYYFHQKLVTEMRRGRLFLAGDSAHQMPPFGAQGMNSGGKDAANLCWKLTAVLRDRAGPQLLDSYHAERHAHARATIALSTRIGQIANIRSRSLALLRDCFFWTANRIPKVRAWFAAQRYLPRQRYRQGLVLHPPPRRDRASLVGRMVPGPMVQDCNGRTGHFDAWLAGEFALVSVDAATAVAGHPLWRWLGCRRLAFGMPPEGFETLWPLDERWASVAERHRGEVLVVRPDLYVAAAVRPDRLDETADGLARLLGDPAAAQLTTATVEVAA